MSKYLLGVESNILKASDAEGNIISEVRIADDYLNRGDVCFLAITRMLREIKEKGNPPVRFEGVI